MDNRKPYRKEYKPKRIKKEGELKTNEKRCPYCNGRMKCRGPKNTVGTIYWKCKNKKCGRTTDYRKDPPKEVIPLVYIDKLRRFI